jgi:hypothetical protein
MSRGDATHRKGEGSLENERKFWLKIVLGLVVLSIFLWWKVFTLTGVLWWDFTIPEEERLPATTNEEFDSPYRR